METSQLQSVMKHRNMLEGILVGVLMVVFGSLLLSNIRDAAPAPEHDEYLVLMSSIIYSNGISPTTKGMWSQLESDQKAFPLAPRLANASYQFFGPDIFSRRKLIILLKTLSLAPLYIVLRSFVSPVSALIVLAFYAFCSLHIASSVVLHDRGFSIFFASFAIGFLALIRPNIHKLRLAIFALLAGLCSSATLATYNLSYVFPIFMFFLLIWKLRECDLPRNPRLFVIGAYLLPLVVTFSSSFKVFREQFASRNYALTYSVLGHGWNPFEIVGIMASNFLQSLKLLFVGLSWSASDGMAAHPGTLVGSLFALLAAFGLVTCFKNRKSLPYVAFFVLQFLTYQIFMGLWRPRMWLVTLIGIVFVAGVGIENALAFVDRQRRLVVPARIILAIFLVWHGISGWNMFTKHTAKTAFYKPEFVELYSVAASLEAAPPKRTAVLFGSPILADAFFATRTYAQLTHPGSNVAQVATLKRTDLQIFDEKEFSEEKLAAYDKLLVFEENGIPAHELLTKNRYVQTACSWTRFRCFVKNPG